MRRDIHDQQLNRCSEKDWREALGFSLLPREAECPPAPSFQTMSLVRRQPRVHRRGFLGIRGQWLFACGLQYHEYTPRPPPSSRVGKLLRVVDGVCTVFPVDVRALGGVYCSRARRL